MNELSKVKDFRFEINNKIRVKVHFAVQILLWLQQLLFSKRKGILCRITLIPTLKNAILIFQLIQVIECPKSRRLVRFCSPPFQRWVKKVAILEFRRNGAYIFMYRSYGTRITNF